MNENIKNKINTYRRQMDDARVNTSIYSFIFIFTVTVYLFGGLIPLARKINEKTDTLAQLENLNIALQRKVDNLNASRADISAAKFHVAELEAAIPKRGEFENFLITLVGKAATAGFRQQRFIIQDTGTGAAEVRVIYQGPMEQLPVFIASIEEIARLTIIEDVKFYKRGDITNLTLILKVFYLAE